MSDLLPGGKADKIPPSAFPAKKVERGARVEREHTSNKTLAKEIARDHLSEDPAYYEKLRKMEKSAMVRGLLDETREIEKTAILGSLALGAGLHMGSNALYKGFVRNTDRGRGFEAGQVATGYRHGLEGKKINPIARNVATYGVGPESLVNYDLGTELGKQLAPMGKGKRYRQLKKLRKNVAMSEHVRHAPMGESVVPAVNRILGNKQGFMDKIPTVAAGAAPTLGQRAVSAGIGAAAIAAEPHTAVHMGVNGIRNFVGRSKQGQTFMKEQFKQGLQHGNLSRPAQHAADLVISPAAFDTRRLGAAMRAEAQADPTRAGRIGMSLGGQASLMPGVREAVIKAKRGLEARTGQPLPPMTPGIGKRLASLWGGLKGRLSA